MKVEIEQIVALQLGELTPEQASAVFRALATDSALREDYRAVQSTDALLEAVDHPVPEALQRRVLEASRLAAPTRRFPWRAALTGLALAAGALFLVRGAIPQPVPLLTLDSRGVQVDGHVALASGSQRVELDGLGRVELEDEMKNLLLGAGGGAVLTLMMSQGSAVLMNGEGEPRTLAVGEPATIQLAPGAAPVAPPSVIPGPDGSQSAEIERLRKELEVLRVQLGLTEGQLAISGTQPLLWKDRVPEAVEERQLEADVQEVIEDLGEASLDRMLCDEYPCISVLRVQDEAAAERYFDVGHTQLDDASEASISVRTMSHDGEWFAFYSATADGLADVDDNAVNHRVLLRIHEYFDTL